jgi:hypothetical protein
VKTLICIHTGKKKYDHTLFIRLYLTGIGSFRKVTGIILTQMGVQAKSQCEQEKEQVILTSSCSSFTLYSKVTSTVLFN